MPKVTDPGQQDERKTNSIFEWDMGDVSYTSSKIVVGKRRGSDNIYPGRELPYGTTKDDRVYHPRNGGTYHARVRYRKTADGPWCTDDSEIRRFISA